MFMAIALLVLLLASPAVHAVQYTVGDGSGWTQQSYTSWVSGKTFTVGDTLVFNYGGSHGVDVVNKGDYDSCTSGNAIKSYNDGATTITLDTAGPMYFICPTFGHCGSGMKLAVNVVASGTTPSTGTPPTTPSPPSSGSETPPTTPSTTPSSGTASPPPPPSTNGAITTIVNMNNLMLGSLLVVGATLAFMG